MIVKLLTEHHLEFLSLKGGCRGSFKTALVQKSNCWKSHAAAHFIHLLADYQVSDALPGLNNSVLGKIRIYHECEGRIEKTVPRIAG